MQRDAYVQVYVAIGYPDVHYTFLKYIGACVYNIHMHAMYRIFVIIPGGSACDSTSIPSLCIGLSSLLMFDPLHIPYYDKSCPLQQPS